MVNEAPSGSNAPSGVFDNVLSFDEFKQKLINHFNSGRGTIMMDDGLFALSAWGYRNGNEFELLIADPHIKSNREQKLTGLYRVVLSEEGRQLSNTVS